MKRWEIGVFCFGIAVDQISKYIASATLSFFAPVSVVSHYVSLVLVHNYGAAYGIFEYQRGFLVGLSAVVVVGCIGYLVKTKDLTPLARIGVIVLISGAAGNLIDRVLFGYVIDFINIQILPVFNIADTLINIGVVCLLGDTIRAKRTH
jgi:signal peptidase II